MSGTSCPPAEDASLPLPLDRGPQREGDGGVGRGAGEGAGSRVQARLDSVRPSAREAGPDPRGRELRRVLGDHIFGNYVEAKKNEWAEYIALVHDWEIERYLAAY